jgi:hypothetical protein
MPGRTGITVPRRPAVMTRRVIIIQKTFIRNTPGYKFPTFKTLFEMFKTILIFEDL